MTSQRRRASLDALQAQLAGDAVQVLGVGVAVAAAVAVQLRLVVDAVPGDAVLLARGVRGTHGEDQTPPPRLLQQSQDLGTASGVQNIAYNTNRDMPD